MIQAAARPHPGKFLHPHRLFTLFKVGAYVQQTRLGRALDFHFRKHMPRVFTGEASDSRYSMAMVTFMLKHGLAGTDPAEFAVR